jgi:hypothetical protein
MEKKPDFETVNVVRRGGKLKDGNPLGAKLRKGLGAPMDKLV